MIYVLYVLHAAVSIFLIMVVLLQQGKGADLSVFGGGASQAAFGARGAANVLHKLTVVCFIVFIVTTLSIGLVQSRGSTIMTGVAPPEAAAPAPEEAGAPPPEDTAGAAAAPLAGQEQPGAGEATAEPEASPGETPTGQTLEGTEDPASGSDSQ